MPSNHLILCCPLLLPPSIFPSIRVFSHESVLCTRWPKYWSFSFSISPSNAYSGLISSRMDWLDLLQAKGLSRVFSNTTAQKHQLMPLRTGAHFYTCSQPQQGQRDLGEPNPSIGTCWRLSPETAEAPGAWLCEVQPGHASSSPGTSWHYFSIPLLWI